MVLPSGRPGAPSPSPTQSLLPVGLEVKRGVTLVPTTPATSPWGSGVQSL